MLLQSLGFGTTLSAQVGTEDPIVLARITDFTPPKSTSADVEIATFDADVTPAGLPILDSIGGWFDCGFWSIKLDYDKGGAQAEIIKGFQGIEGVTWIVTYPDTKTRTFTGRMTDCGENLFDEVHVIATQDYAKT